MPSDNTERLFLDTKPGHLFFKAAIPGAMGMLASSLYYLLEGILVGRVLGAEAFAGLNLAMPFVIIKKGREKGCQWDILCGYHHDYDSRRCNRSSSVYVCSYAFQDDGC